jgi:hypothetical protein
MEPKGGNYKELNQLNEIRIFAFYNKMRNNGRECNTNNITKLAT